MLTVEQIVEYVRRLVAEQRLAGDSDGLWQTQRAAGLLMKAAEAADDRQTAYTFRVIAADAANAIEALRGDA